MEIQMTLKEVKYSGANSTRDFVWWVRLEPMTGLTAGI